jgi:cell division protein FtsB
VIAGVLLFISSATVKAAWEMYQTFDVASKERSSTETELEVLRKEHTTMTASLAEFSTDRGVEAAVRERFGVVKPGEGEIRIVRTKSIEPVEEVAGDNPFSRLFGALFTW